MPLQVELKNISSRYPCCRAVARFKTNPYVHEEHFSRVCPHCKECFTVVKTTDPETAKADLTWWKPSMDGPIKVASTK